MLRNSVNVDRSMAKASCSPIASKTEPCPQREFEGEIFIVERESQAHRAKERLYAEMRKDKSFTIGLDLEWVSQKKGEENPPALIQTATQNCCVLWRVCLIKDAGGKPKLPLALQDILLDGGVEKIGFDITQDKEKLRRHFDLVPRPYIDVQVKCSQMGYGSRAKRLSLSDACKILLGFSLADLPVLPGCRYDYESHRLWAEADLLDDQVVYAATDAWASLQISAALAMAPTAPARERR